MARAAAVLEEEQQTTTRLNVNLNAEAAQELSRIGERLHRNKTEVVRLALGLLSIFAREKAHGNHLAIVSKEGKILKEIVLPV